MREFGTRELSDLPTPVVLRPTDHRDRIHDGRRDRRRDLDRSIPGRDRRAAALMDISAHRVVALDDLAAVHWAGHRYAARAGLQQLKREGLVHELRTDSGNVMIATKAGAKAAAAEARRCDGWSDGQAFWSGGPRREDLQHDAGVYRAVLAAREQLAAHGIHRIRIRIDRELKEQVFRAAENAGIRAVQGVGGQRRQLILRQAAAEERRRQAAALELPTDEMGRTQFPDVQVEFERDGQTTRVNIEVVSDQYRAGAIMAKARAGFVLHGANAKAGRLIAKAIRNATRSTPGGRDGRDPVPRDLFEL